MHRAGHLYYPLPPDNGTDVAASASAFLCEAEAALRPDVFGRLRERVDASGVLPAWLVPALCGTVASLTAGLLLYPNDTIRRRLQYGRREGGALEEGYVATARTLVREGGVARLFRGLPPYLAKAAPAAAVQFGAFHYLKRLLPPSERRRD